MMFRYVLCVSWILLWNCYAHQSYSQLSESSQSQTTTQKHAPIIIRKDDLRNLGLSVATRSQDNRFKESSDVIASVPCDSDDTFYSLNVKNRGIISYQEKPSTHNAKPLSLSYTKNGTKEGHKIYTITDHQRIKQPHKLHSKEKKRLYEENPKSKYEKVSKKYESPTADKTINNSRNDKDFFMNSKIENKKVPTLNHDSLRERLPALRSVSNDDLTFNDFGVSDSDISSDNSANLMSPPSYGKVESRAYDDPFRAYHPSSPENHRSFNRPGKQPPSRPPAQKPGISKPIVISCNLYTSVGQLTPIRYFVNLPYYIIARRKRAALSVPSNVN